ATTCSRPSAIAPTFSPICSRSCPRDRPYLAGLRHHGSHGCCCANRRRFLKLPVGPIPLGGARALGGTRRRDTPMIRPLIAGAAALALCAGPAMAQQKTIKIGFISTFSGPAAAIGND